MGRGIYEYEPRPNARQQTQNHQNELFYFVTRISRETSNRNVRFLNTKKHQKLFLFFFSLARVCRLRAREIFCSKNKSTIELRFFKQNTIELRALNTTMAEQTDDDQAAVSVLMGLGNLVCHQVSENTVADLPPPPVRVAYNCKICHHRVFCGRKWHEESKECEKNGACRDPEDADKCPFKTNNETVWKQLHKAAYTAQKAAQKREKQEQEQAKKLASKKQKLDLNLREIVG